MENSLTKLMRDFGRRVRYLYGLASQARVGRGWIGSGVCNPSAAWLLRGCGGIMRRLLLVVLSLLLCACAVAAQQTSGSASPATATVQSASTAPQEIGRASCRERV